LHAVVLHDQGVFDALPKGLTREFHPTCGWAQYMEILAGCDIALLPLGDTTFNRFKSDLKLVEALAAGAVPICSPVVYGEAHPGGSGYVRWAQSPQEWAQQLCDALARPTEWAEARAEGYAYVHAHRMQWQQDFQRLQVYRQWMADQIRLEAERRERLSVWKAEAS
jgi:glycosyltransferase involved in cell wall biosynthesis